MKSLNTQITVSFFLFFFSIQTALALNCSTQTELPAAECDALNALYTSTNGDSWTNKDGWNGNKPCSAFGVFCNISGVYAINLQENNLTGSIPLEIGDFSGLEYLNLHLNNLTGPIPPSIGNLVKLVYLYLSRNQLSGVVPIEVGNLLRLEFLWLYSNSLSGTIPSEIKKLVNLSSFHLANNQFTGTIPPEIGNLASLEYLNLGWNSLSGSIPPEIGNLKNLVELYLYANQLSGPMPLQIGNLSNLTSLSIFTNQLSGTIPSEIGNLVNLSLLDLHWNELSGSIPPEIGNLSNLNKLSLYGNQLSGNLPPEIGNLTKLNSLDLSRNQLTGKVPFSVAKLALTLAECRLYLKGYNSPPLCIPNTYQYNQLGIDPICGLPLSPDCVFPWATFFPAILGQSNHLQCETTTYAGSNKGEEYIVEMGETQGSFDFYYKTGEAKDRLIIFYEGSLLYDTGCVGEEQTIPVVFSGESSKINVKVIPNCAGTPDTGWIFTVHCPM